MKAKQQFHNGLTLVEALIVVAVLTVLVVMLLPAMARPKRHSPLAACRNNFKQVGLSFRQWALDNNDKHPMQVSVTNGGAMEWARQGIAWSVFQVMSNELNTPKILFCPNDSNVKRVMANTFGSPDTASVSSQIPFTNNQNLSYFVNLDATETETNLLLTGDSQIGRAHV